LNLLVHSDERAAARTVAGVIANAASDKPDLVLGLATGRTSVPVYEELARLHARGELDLSRAGAFNLDELRLPGDHPASFQSFMRRHAWTRIGLDPRHCDIPDGEADPDLECARYDRAVAEAGGLDLVFLGVGEDGHVAYNLPGPPTVSTHSVVLPAALAESLRVPEEWRPLEAITMGLGTLRSARRLVMLAIGPGKAKAVRALLEGPETPDWPSSLLRGHGRLDVVLDIAAAGGQWAIVKRIMRRR
jgi:glucosamine-6-phosphate deaminase